MERRHLEAELGQEHFFPPAEGSTETSIQEGEIESIVITNNPLIFGRPISINVFNNIISSQTLVHLLCTIFVPEPQIGTCG